MGKAQYSRRLLRWQSPIVPWDDVSTRLSKRTRQPWCRDSGTGCPPIPRTEKVVCFFQPAQKFKTRYATIGFCDRANLDDGAMWPTTYALKGLTDIEEVRIAALVKTAMS